MMGVMFAGFLEKVEDIIGRRIVKLDEDEASVLMNHMVWV